jgi:AcrR family transcriptional regulator
MPPETLTPERILEATEDVLRRYGPAKATVVDVARVLGVSHGSVYRHFASKAALRDAVTERWLARVSAPLADIAQGTAPADERLRQWLDALIAIKRKKVRDEPEMFATYHALAMEAREVTAAHVDGLVDQLARIVADGISEGVFDVADARATARAIGNATARFHNPAHAASWSNPDIDRAFEEVWSLILNGLRRSSRA